MAKTNINKTGRRQADKSKKARAVLGPMARERHTAENKARRMLATLRRTPNDSQTARALLDLIVKFPHIKHMRVAG